MSGWLLRGLLRGLLRRSLRGAFCGTFGGSRRHRNIWWCGCGGLGNADRGSIVGDVRRAAVGENPSVRDIEKRDVLAKIVRCNLVEIVPGV